MNDNDNNHKRPLDDELDGVVVAEVKAEEMDANNHQNNNNNNNIEDGDQPPKIVAVHQPDGLQPPPIKRVRTSEELDIRFLVSSKEAGAIIGKGGANINHLRKHYKSSVTVPDCPGPERVLSIVATLETLGDILTEVIGFIDDRSATNPEHEVEIRLLIHTSHAGGIIGKGGARIKDLRDQTKAAIKVFSQCCPLSTERICAIQGPPTIVINAIKIVLEIILASPIKGPVKLYDPHNFDIYFAPEYGGYTEPVPNNFRSRGPNMPYGRGGGGRGRGGGGRRGDGVPWHQDAPPMPMPPEPWVGQMPYNRPAADRRPHNPMYSRNWSPQNPRLPVSQPLSPVDQPYWSDVIPNDNITTGAPIHSPNLWSDGYGAGNDESSFTSGDQNIIENIDGSATATISVPNNVAGAIIGKGGNRIRIVRRDSGAEISIDSAVGTGNERKITVKGNADQVRVACSMIHKSISENSTTRRY
ncbi:heterogeneous nuclear ribonucleoprotein K-like [Oppia nitens]|uniref:heterogeneous nuclear ribonucleoprotein K-like n=1 Tax=Oppia nitens TaxID=1686743 RepID=UPI0023DBF552|nr:heterogeneous nuclear ribonucleoprotein K-like [Oppia nitens]